MQVKGGEKGERFTTIGGHANKVIGVINEDMGVKSSPIFTPFSPPFSPPPEIQKMPINIDKYNNSLSLLLRFSPPIARAIFLCICACGGEKGEKGEWSRNGRFLGKRGVRMKAIVF